MERGAPKGKPEVPKKKRPLRSATPGTCYKEKSAKEIKTRRRRVRSGKTKNKMPRKKKKEG